MLRFLLLLLVTGVAGAQVTSLGGGLAHRQGSDPETHIDYSLYFLNAAGATEFEANKPTLTAQCWRDAKGKMRFDVMFNFGGVNNIEPYQPFHPTKDHPTKSAIRGYEMLKFQFIGYVKVKPEKLEFRKLWSPDGQLLYNQTGFRSHNLGDASYVMLYLQSLPTVRVSQDEDSVEFEATKLLARLRTDTLCSASGLQPVPIQRAN